MYFLSVVNTKNDDYDEIMMLFSLSKAFSLHTETIVV